MQKTIYLVFSITLLSILATGCSTLSSINGSKLPTAPMAESGQGSFTLSMESDFGPPKVYTGVVDDSMTVQKALEVSGAMKKYRSMEIEVLRRVQESGRGLRMQVKYNVGKKRVDPSQNYAVHPGDRILVRPAKSSPLGAVGRYLGL